ncbi:MAG: MBL fold metallo-hydrolase [Desulfurococcales archaeon]|nr:MBL fold metallo-hydrolase [Desulfurococcales archaeon]
MLISIVGGGGSYPPPGYGGPSALIDTGGEVLVLDCGEDCLTGLAVSGYHPCDVEAVYVSHVHIDHWAGLPSLVTAKAAESCPRLRVVAEEDVLVDLKPLLLRVTAASLEPSIVPVVDYSLDGFRLRTFRTEHPVPTYGLTIAEGGVKLVTYTSDSGFTGALKSEARGARVLIAEATLPSSLEGIAAGSGHMTVSDFLSLAEESGAEHAIAVHLSPGSLSELRERLARGDAPHGVLVGSRGLQLRL